MLQSNNCLVCSGANVTRHLGEIFDVLLSVSSGETFFERRTWHLEALIRKIHVTYKW